MSQPSAEVETTVVRELECELTPAELLERGDAMAACDTNIETLKAERRRLNAEVRGQSDKRSDLAKIIEAKSETRDVPCTWEPHYDDREYALVRQDTRAEIERREMPEADLQMRLLPSPTPITKGKKNAKNSAK